VSDASNVLLGDKLLTREGTRRALADLQGKKTPISLRTLYRYEAKGMPFVKRGVMRLYDIEAVRRWLLGEVPAPRRSGRPPRERSVSATT
jgi:hypothetical protein